MSYAGRAEIARIKYEMSVDAKLNKFFQDMKALGIAGWQGSTCTMATDTRYDRKYYARTEELDDIDDIDHPFKNYVYTERDTWPNDRQFVYVAHQLDEAAKKLVQDYVSKNSDWIAWDGSNWNSILVFVHGRKALPDFLVKTYDPKIFSDRQAERDAREKAESDRYAAEQAAIAARKAERAQQAQKYKDLKAAAKQKNSERALKAWATKKAKAAEAAAKKGLRA